MNKRISPNFQLLLQSVKAYTLDDSEKAVEEIIERNSIDWDDLFQRADYHCIKPQLGRLLNKISPQLIPASIRENLREANHENLFRQLRNVAEFFRLKQLLDEAGILAVPFKGFWIASKFYGNLADRESVDVDLLIDERDLEKVKEILLADGFNIEEPLPQLTNEYVVNHLCECNFDKYENGERILHFEFHWRIHSAEFMLDIKLADLQSQVTTGIIQNRELKVFTPSAIFLLAVMHHGGKDQFIQLKQVMDIARILKKQPNLNWEWIIKEAKRFYMENLVYIAVNLAHQLTGTEIPQPIERHVNSRFIQRLANSRISLMNDPPSSWYGQRHEFKKNLFHFRTRNNPELKKRIVKLMIKGFISHYIIPKNFHHYFFNRKIRVGNKTPKA